MLMQKTGKLIFLLFGEGHMEAIFANKMYPQWALKALKVSFYTNLGHKKGRK
jgi:hypothetical protein